MKNIFTLLVCIIFFSFALKAQTAKWFVTVSSGLSVGGPGTSVKNNMEKNGFNTSPQGWGNFITGGHTKYPHVFHEFPLLVMLGKQISTNGSVYLIIGQSNKGLVKGFNDIASISLNYNVLQFTAGYQFSFSTTRFKIGAGPSVFAFKYENALAAYGEEKHSILPGLAVTGRMPFGKEKKILGIELFLEANFALPAEVEELHTHMSSLKASNVNMIHGVIGLSFALRK